MKLPPAIIYAMTHPQHPPMPTKPVSCLVYDMSCLFEIRFWLLHANHVKTIELIPSKSRENVEENVLLWTGISNSAGGGQ